MTPVNGRRACARAERHARPHSRPGHSGKRAPACGSSTTTLLASRARWAYLPRTRVPKSERLHSGRSSSAGLRFYLSPGVAERALMIIGTATGVGEKLDELAPVQAPSPGAQAERRHERSQGRGDHWRTQSASQMHAQRTAGESAITRSMGIMPGTVAPGVAQAVSLTAQRRPAMSPSSRMRRYSR